MKERLPQQQKLDETQARKRRTEAMKVYSFINKWIANGERSIDK